MTQRAQKDGQRALAAAAVMALLALPAMGGTTFPFTDSFEVYDEGTAIPSVGSAWDPGTPSGLVATAGSGTYTATPPFPDATHAQVGAFDDVARVEFDSTGGLTKSYLLTMAKPVLGNTPKSVTLGKDPEYAFHFNADGHIVVFHTDLDPVSGEYPQVWTEITSHTPVSTSSWYHIEICVDYRTGKVPIGGGNYAYQKFFQISLNGTPLSTYLAVKQPTFYFGSAIPEGDRNGTWFHCADFDEIANNGMLPGRPEGFGMEGFGQIDDLFANSSTDVPSNSLSIASTEAGVTGTPPVPSTESYPYGSNVVCAIDDGTISYGSNTQLVYKGVWTNGTGTVAPVGTGTSVTVVMNEDSSLTWVWEYQYRLQTAASGPGSVDVSESWYSVDTIVEITPTPDSGATFTGWSGDVPPANTNDNPLYLRMDRARSITANFSGSAPQYTAQGTPHSWLEGYGITENFEAADTNDWDKDGALTWEEYMAGTEPDDSNSVFTVSAFARQGSDYKVDWYGTTNHGVTNPFNVLRGSALQGGGNWSTVATDIGRSPDGDNTWSDTSPPEGAVYYRIEIPRP